MFNLVRRINVSLSLTVLAGAASMSWGALYMFREFVGGPFIRWDASWWVRFLDSFLLASSGLTLMVWADWIAPRYPLWWRRRHELRKFFKILQPSRWIIHYQK